MDSDTIRKLLAEATPGPWVTRRGITSDEIDIAPTMVNGRKKPVFGKWAEFACVRRGSGPRGRGRANARLIAAAPDLAAEVLRLRDLLGRWVNIATHCDITDGSCCCGDDMKNHPQQTGHYPVDHGAYVADQTLQDTLAALGETPDA